MKTEEIKRWEIIQYRGKKYLRDKHKNEGILIEIHESQIVVENDIFVVILCFKPDLNYKMYCSHSIYDFDINMYLYMFKKKGEDICFTSFQ